MDQTFLNFSEERRGGGGVIALNERNVESMKRQSSHFSIYGGKPLYSPIQGYHEVPPLKKNALQKKITLLQIGTMKVKILSRVDRAIHKQLGRLYKS